MNTKSKQLKDLAVSLAEKEKNEEAIEALRRSMRLDTNNSEMTEYINMATSMYESGDIKHSRIFLNTFLEYCSHYSAYFLLGKIAVKERNKEDALKYYELGFSIFDDSSIAPYKEYFYLCKEIKNEDKAVYACKKVLAINKHDKESISFIAECHKEIKAYKEAISLYVHLVKDGEADYNDYNNYGFCLNQIGEYKKAEEMYILALENAPFNKAEIDMFKKIQNASLSDNYPDIEKSEKEYRENIKKGKDVSSYFHLGNIEYIKGHFDKAAEYYKQAKDIYEASIEKA